MRPTADEVNAIDVFEAIVGPQIQHLVETVRQIERSPLVDLILAIPILRGDDVLETDPLFHIDKTCFRDSLKYSIAKPTSFFAPVYIGILMRNRDQNIKGATARRRQGGIGDA